MFFKVRELRLVLLLLIPGCMCMSCSDGIDQIQPAGSDVKVYFVAPTGNDSNKGTIHAPFKTIATALKNAIAGDTVLVREGTYFEKVTFPKSGTSDKMITLKAFPGEKPVIDGSYMQVLGYWEGLVTFSRVRYVTIEGFDVCNVITSTPYVDPEGITVKDGCRDITIRNCRIYNIKSNATLDGWRSAHAILVLGNSGDPLKNITIDGCDIHDTQTGTSETVTIAGNVDGFRISNNKVYNTENIGIIIADGGGLYPAGNPAVNFARNGVVCDNELFNNTHTRSPEVWGENAFGAIAIYVGGAANTIVERNKVYNNDRGIGLVSENETYPTRDCIVRNNFVYHSNRTGIYLGGYLNYTSGGTHNCYVVNNTLFFNNAVRGAFGEIEGEIRLTENCTGNFIANNIVYARPTDVFVHKYTNTGNNNLIDYNIYYTTGSARWIWNGVSHNSFEEWQTASVNDLHSVHGVDPLLISTSSPDLHIQAASLAKNSGLIVSDNVNGATDIDREPRIVNNKINTGADQN